MRDWSSDVSLPISAMKLRPEVHQVRIQTDNLGSLDSTARSLVEELEKSATQEPEDLASIAQSEEEREHVA